MFERTSEKRSRRGGDLVSKVRLRRGGLRRNKYHLSRSYRAKKKQEDGEENGGNYKEINIRYRG